MMGGTGKETTVSTVPDIVTPQPDETQELAQLLSFLEAHEEANGTTPDSPLYLSGPDRNDRVSLTVQASAILKEIVAALSKGQAISVLTRDQEISTQQAADILGLSRPTVVRLIDTGELPAHIPGTERRKLRLADVLAYREELHERRNQFIAESSNTYEDVHPEAVPAMLARARKAR